MKRLHAFLAALCCALPFSFAHAQGLGNFVDAANYSTDPTIGNFGIGGDSEQKLAQTLTVERGGTLEGVFLPIACDPTTTVKVHVEIHDVVSGMPGPTVLADRAVPPALFDDLDLRFTFVKFPGSLVLAPGQQIAIVVYRPRGPACGMRQSALSFDYPGGHGFFDARPNPPGWVPFSTFAGTSAATSDDLPFILVLS